MKKYEVMFIVRPDLEEATIKETAATMKSLLEEKGAKVVEEKDMGQRELAYEIKKHNTGYYFYLVVESDNSDATVEFDRVALINENIIRHLIVRIGE